jgi:hypothetical protein
MSIVFAILILGWLLASTIGAWAYFAGKPNDDSNFSVPKFIFKRSA